MTDLPLAFPEFAALVAETFDRTASSVTRDTRCSDIPGWDSLGHSVLLSRLDKRFHLSLGEADASPAETVGELFDRIAGLPAPVTA